MTKQAHIKNISLELDGFVLTMVAGKPSFVEDGEVQPITPDYYYCIESAAYAHLKHLATMNWSANELAALQVVIEGVYEADPAIDPERHEADKQADYEYAQSRSAEVWGAAI